MRHPADGEHASDQGQPGEVDSLGARTTRRRGIADRVTRIMPVRVFLGHGEHGQHGDDRLAERNAEQGHLCRVLPLPAGGDVVA